MNAALPRIPASMATSHFLRLRPPLNSQTSSPSFELFTTRDSKNREIAQVSDRTNLTYNTLLLERGRRSDLQPAFIGCAWRIVPSETWSRSPRVTYGNMSPWHTLSPGMPSVPMPVTDAEGMWRLEDREARGRATAMDVVMHSGGRLFPLRGWFPFQMPGLHDGEGRLPLPGLPSI